MTFDTDDIPKPDRFIDGQTYWCVREKDYVRKDGTPGTVLTWQTYCAVCGAAFQFASADAAHLNRRCRTHQQPGIRVGGKADRKRRAIENAEAESLIR